MLQDILNNYKKCAGGLAGYKDMTKTELANGYCDADDAGDELKRSQYFSALMIRYFYKVYDLYNESKSTGLSIEDISSWVSESLDIGLKYRRWRDPKNALSKDPNGPDKVFQRCFISTRQRWYKYFNQDKRKLNHNHDTYSFEESIEVYKDSAEALNQPTFNQTTVSGSYDVVQTYINKGKIIEAVIIDAIAHQDSFTDNLSKKASGGVWVEKISSEKIVKQFHDINPVFLRYFQDTYKVNKEDFIHTVEHLAKSDKFKIRSYIKKTLADMKSHSEVISLLCS